MLGNKVQRFTRATKITLGVCVLGALLHGYTVLFNTDGGTLDFGGVLFLLGLFLWSCAPYTICAVVAGRYNWPAPAVGAATGILAFDCYVYYSVFVAPTGSTAALALLFAPLWNLVVVGPLGAIISWPLHHIAAGGRRNSH